MNRALWPATVGYFLDELLETDAAANDRVRRFFTADVVARGSLPAIRVGKQPYGVLVTSAFNRWQIDERIDGEEAAFLRRVHEVLTKVEAQWQQLVGQVSHVDAPGDSFAHLLNILGLHATSVDYPAADRHLPDVPVESRAPDDRRELRRLRSDGALLPGSQLARHPAARTISGSSFRACRRSSACSFRSAPRR